MNWNTALLLALGTLPCLFNAVSPTEAVAIQKKVAPAEDNRTLEPGYSIKLLDLAQQSDRQFIVDRESGQYLGHPTTVLLEDGKTILCVYPQGHGRGPIVMKRSTDGGMTWSDRLPVPDNWATSKETPTIHRVVDAQGKRRLILFSGLYPIRMAYSDDDGVTWSSLNPIGDFGGIVAMGCVEQIGAGRYLALFHDDGRFIRDGKQKEADGNRFHVYKTISEDGGLTWSQPVVIATHSQAHLCEPGLIRSPDGKQMAVLLRENSRQFNSFVITSDDEGETWSQPRQVSAALTGDRHTGVYTDDGRLFISFRDTTRKSETAGDWVAWVGTYDDIVSGNEGQYRVRLMDNHKGFDCAYPGVLRLADDTIVTTTYGHWESGESPYVVTVRLKLAELDAMASAKPVAIQEGAHWNRFRGPDGSGKLPGKFPAKFQREDFAWSSKLPGIGNGSPVIWGDRVFVQSADPASGQRFLQCLDIKSGEELWSETSPGAVERIHAWGSFASSSPAVDADHVYVVWGSRESTRLTAMTHEGESVWHVELGTSVYTHGYGASPTIMGDQVILFQSQQADQLQGNQKPGVSRMLAFDRETGEQHWATELKTTRVCYGVPIAYTSQGGQEWIIGANTGNGVFALAADTGELLWELPIVKQRSVASPVIHDQLLLASSGSGGGGNEVVAVDLETRQEVYRISRNANYVPTLIVHGDWIFVPGDKGILSCVELTSGELLNRKRLGPGAFGISSSPVVSGDHLYVLSDSGTVKVIQATPEMEELAEVDLGEPTRATPAGNESFLLFRTDSALHALPAER